MGILDQKMDGKITKDELTGEMGANIKANFDRIDRNHDGVIDATELAAVTRFMKSHRGPAPASDNTAKTAAPAAAPAAAAAAGGSR
jgi:Ca2+-binding EF-hand superfamily protein